MLYMCRTTIGDRAFAVAGPRAWNSLPAELRFTWTFSVFKRHLKHHFLIFCFYELTLPLLMYRAFVAADAAYGS